MNESDMVVTHCSNTNQRLGVAFTLLLTHIAFRWTICVSHLTVR